MDKIIKHRSISKIKDFIINSCGEQVSNEVCGFVGWDPECKKYIATVEKNEAQDPQKFFVLNPASFLKFKNEFSLLGIYHSHVVGDEMPSEFDMKMSEACCLPFFTYSLNTKKIHIYEPSHADYDVKLFARLKDKLT
jgi:proteasome lid subunit RPN8/RPN11